jgi:hypothetical protein
MAGWPVNAGRRPGLNSGLFRAGLTQPRGPRYGQHMAALLRRKLTSKGGPALKVRLWGLASTYLVGVVVFVSVALLRGDDTFWSALITGAIVIGFILGGSLWAGRMTRSDSGKFLLFAFSILFASVMGVMIWRGFNWLPFTIASAGLLVGFGGYWLSRQEHL